MVQQFNEKYCIVVANLQVKHTNFVVEIVLMMLTSTCEVVHFVSVKIEKGKTWSYEIASCRTCIWDCCGNTTKLGYEEGQ